MGSAIPRRSAAYFFALNRNRRSIELDYRSADGARGPSAGTVRRHRDRELSSTPVRSTRPRRAPGCMSEHRVGVDPGCLGLRSTRRSPGFDAMVQARTGVMSINGIRPRVTRPRSAYPSSTSSRASTPRTPPWRPCWHHREHPGAGRDIRGATARVCGRASPTKPPTICWAA